MPRELLERMQHDFWESQRAIDYMTKTRGFEEDTLRYFGIGYSPTRDMVATPMFDIKGNPIGIIGRSIEGKQFNNSKDLPRGRTLWNIHNAKKHSTAIVMEANFDGMRVHESGYPGVVGILGGHFSDEHADQLARHFERIIIMTDNDDPSEHNYDNPEKGVKCRKCAVLGLDACKGHNPGRELGERVAEEMTARSKPVLWAMYSEEVIYPAKDAAAMTKEQVRACIENAVPNYRYHQLDASVV